MKKISLTFLILIIGINLFADIQAVWVPIWDLTTAESIDTMLSRMDKLKINQILAEVRYRADALYTPNRINSDYPNPDPRNYLLEDNDFDPLLHLIDSARKYDIEVHAWITTFVASTKDLKRLPKDHPFFENPHWVTTDFSRKDMHNETYEGAFFDPGNPQVREYTKNVILDIVSNYDLDGIHLDYIRYPDKQFGYNAMARSEYEDEIKYKDAESWRVWKQAQVGSFVKMVSEEAKKILPGITVSAAVFPELEVAVDKYSQNWPSWLENGWLDKIYLMAYTKEDEKLEAVFEQFPQQKFRNNIVAGLRAWDYGSNYSVNEINSKIRLTKNNKFAGIALFSYSGLVKHNYLKTIKLN